METKQCIKIENHNKMINVIMSTWYKIKHKLSHEHNIKHNRSKMRVLQHSIIGKIEPYNSLVPIYANLVIKTIKLYMNCDITAILMGIANIEHNRQHF